MSNWSRNWSRGTAEPSLRVELAEGGAPRRPTEREHGCRVLVGEDAGEVALGKLARLGARLVVPHPGGIQRA